MSNYGGKQPNSTSFIKQFNDYTPQGIASWIYKSINNKKYITPSDKNVNVYIQNDLYVNGSINNSSDIRLKENIYPLTNNYCDDILKINPIKYTFKEDKNSQIHFGVSAQELEIYFPELVKNCQIIDENGFKSVNYLELIPLLIVKIKNMQNKIDDLESKFCELFRVNTIVNSKNKIH